MRTMGRLLVIGLLVAGQLGSQTLEIHSEFLRVSPQGEILDVDATPKPREILSPAVARNGFASTGRPHTAENHISGSMPSRIWPAWYSLWSRITFGLRRLPAIRCSVSPRAMSVSSMAACR